MDRRRAMSPVYTRQWSSSTTSSTNESPTSSPAHHHSRHASIGTGFSTVKRTQNAAAKAAAHRLAQVMATQGGIHDDDDHDDDDDADDLFGPPPSLVPPSLKKNAARNQNTTNGFHADLPSARTRVGRAPSPSVDFSNRKNILLDDSNGSNVNLPSSRINRATSPAVGRPFAEPPPSVRSQSAGRPTSIRPNTMVPPTLRNPTVLPPVELPTPKARAHGRFPDLGHMDLKDSGNEPDDDDLLDKLDLLQQENENVLEKLREAEKRREEAEARAKQLELQVSSMGEGLSLEAKVMRRKEAAIRQREAALAEAKKRNEGKDEISTLHLELENLRKEAASIMKKLQDTESEAKSLRNMTQRTVLTQEEMEEVVLKRCWLARYWGLAVQYGICADIAESKNEYWSRFAPLPFEIVTSAGQKAKEDFLKSGGNNLDKWSKSSRGPADLTGEGNIETMLSVEMGLREMASLKIEEAVALSMSQRRRPNLVRDTKVVGDPKFMESFELSQEEADDVLFKESWLIYFWKRARDHQVEEDIAEERLQLWTSRSEQSLTLQDAVDVERGLIELRKLGIEQQLWETSRREIEHPSSPGDSTNHKLDAESENSS